MSYSESNPPSFEQFYYCYSPCFIDKSQLEEGDKIIMPLSALNTLAMLDIDYPMSFEVNTYSSERVSHCGVLEFVAEEGIIYMPQWMMQNMGIQDADLVCIKIASLPKCTYVKLQPHTKDFLELTSTKAALEKTLRGFTCLTLGDTIKLLHNNKEYSFDIIECNPASAVCINETDCEIDFSTPLDYKEPEKPQPVFPSSEAPIRGAEEVNRAEQKFQAFTGTERFSDEITSDHEFLIDSSSVTGNDVEKQIENSLDSEMDKLVLDSNEIFSDEEE
ncbi:putative ubiquitin fusion degradation protein Ufd1 [Dioscorea sansibarensis]